MKYLKIQNNGLLDPRLLPLMGGTTKEGNEFKIGQFGTGLKYTLAYLFRNNVVFRIFIGKEEVKLYCVYETIGNTEFEIICINDERTGITTKMGLDWQPWMIIRELWCNALDEGGAINEVVTEVEGEEGKTTFYIQLTREFQDVRNNWNKYFIHDTKPLYEGADFAIYPPGQYLTLYKNGVLIYEDTIKERHPVFAYDIKDARINELREFKGTVSQSVSNCLSRIEDKDVILPFLENVQEESSESNMDLNWFYTWNKAWREAIGTKKIIHYGALEEAAKNGLAIDLNQVYPISKSLFKVLTSQFKDVSAMTMTSGESGEFFESYDEKCEEIVKLAIEKLSDCGYDIHKNLTFKFGFFEDRNVMARVNKRTGVVYINNIHSTKSVFEVMTTIIEENEHYVTGHDDKTRAFQQHFINLYTKQLTKHLQL